MQESDDPHKPSSPLDSECEQQPCTPVETTTVSAASEVLFGISPDDSDPDEEEILAQYDCYIIFLAWQIVNGHTKFVHPAVLDLLVDDLIQNSRIKLWLALKKGILIHNLKALIRCIVHTEFINLVRQHKPVLPLSVDEDGELLSQGKLVTNQSADMESPERIVEREMAVVELLNEAAVGVATMGSCQREAMICSLKETVEDISQLIAIFREHGIAIETVKWPQEKREKVHLKASLSPARKKMRSMKSVSVCV